MFKRNDLDTVVNVIKTHINIDLIYQFPVTKPVSNLFNHCTVKKKRENLLEGEIFINL